MKVLTSGLKVSTVLFFIGLVAFYFAEGFDSALWFGIGGGIALFNFLIACFVVSSGLEKIRNKGLLLGALMFKSMSFVGVVAVVLMFTKPLIFPFTLGIGIVIFGLVVWAALESRHSLKKVSNN